MIGVATSLRLLGLPLLLAALVGTPGLARTAVVEQGPVLRVGVIDGAQPCSDARQGHWQGMAVELWERVAAGEQLPFVYETRDTAKALLKAVQQGQLDVGIGCLTITPSGSTRCASASPFRRWTWPYCSDAADWMPAKRCCAPC